MHPSDALPSELAAFEAWYVDRFKKPLPADYAGMCDWGTWQAAWRARLAAPTQAAPAAADHVEDEVCNEPCGICDDAAPAAQALGYRFRTPVDEEGPQWAGVLSGWKVAATHPTDAVDITPLVAAVEPPRWPVGRPTYPTGSSVP